MIGVFSGDFSFVVYQPSSKNIQLSRVPVIDSEDNDGDVDVDDVGESNMDDVDEEDME